MQNDPENSRRLSPWITLLHRGLVLLTLISLSRGECKSSLFKLYIGRYLPSHVIETAAVTSQIECSLLCLRRNGCESWNLLQTEAGLKCELNNDTMNTELADGLSLRNDSFTFGHRIVLVVGDTTKQKDKEVNTEFKNITYIFTNLGAEGSDGPTDTSGYQGTTLEGLVTLQSGIQEWHVPHTGVYVIESLGAAGANGTCAANDNAGTWHIGGLGAKLSGTFLLKNGTLLKILVGQRGVMGTSFNDRPGGGGGGTFVTFANNTPLVIAGGGGGGGGCFGVTRESDGDSGQVGVIGSRCDAVEGGGGSLCTNEPGYEIKACGGSGLLGDGDDGDALGPGIEAMGFVNGGRGGTIHIGSNGGFGGGGYGWLFAGGGGGYTGGGVWANSTYGRAGGGGSANYGFDTKSGNGNSLDHGMVKIVFVV